MRSGSRGAQLSIVVVAIVVVALALGSVAGAQTGDPPNPSPPAASDTGNNRGTPVPPETVLSASDLVAQGTGTVALFFDDSYVDTDPGGSGEAYNLQQTLTSLGYTVRTFTGTTAAEWNAALTGVRAVVVPEVEKSSAAALGAAMEAGALDALRSFVLAGGRFITFHSRNFDFLEVVLESPGDLSSNENCFPPCNLTAAAAGTEFEGGPASIPNVNSTATVDLSTMPSGTLGMYTDDDGDEAALAVLPTGECGGAYVYFAWDWYMFDGGNFDPWIEVIDRAVDAGGCPPAEAPELVVTFTG